ncbi:MAG: mannose-1-phosphate guanylyltransferase [Bacteroidales bacterium]|nr:mannose-1-phosphate guanylyltransferase [Candidatus Cacconaster caballi]
MNSNFYCIIMAGGVGSRFWPVSRISCPKQFLDILGMGRSFLQMTFDRFAGIVPKENILIVTSDRYAELVREQIPGIPKDNVLLEPYRRNTAPCVAYATYKLLSSNPDATVVVAPADHLITNEDKFENTVLAAMERASETDALYTIGIKPTRPETNFGYIQVSKTTETQIGGHTMFDVKTFTEKPNLEMAKIFLETGEFFWNSGIFIWNLKAIKAELESCLPLVARGFKAGGNCYYTEKEEKFIHHVYAECESVSIDYGVMEKTAKARVLMADFGWSDVGTWQSVYEHSPNLDANGNIIKCGTSMISGVNGSIISTVDSKKLVIVRGMDNVMVVDRGDVLLVCNRDDRTIKDIVTDLMMKDNTEDYL